MLSFLLESTYMAENLRDDRSGQKLNFQFYNFFCILPPGGAMSLFTFSVFGHFDQLRIFFFSFFLASAGSLGQASTYIQNPDGCFLIFSFYEAKRKQAFANSIFLAFFGILKPNH